MYYKKYDLAIILGSGFSDAVNILSNKKEIKCEEFKNYPKSKVLGHNNLIIEGEFKGKHVLMFSGRLHYYEGHTINEVCLPVHISNALGINNIILTGAVGSLKNKIKPGEFVFLKDHISFLPNPLKNNIYFNETKSPFIDLKELYDKKWINSVKKKIKKNIKTHTGVYAAMSGPTYETPKEIQMLNKLGADIVGMSIVPEAIMSKYYEMKVLGLTFVTNYGTGLRKTTLTHADVLKISIDKKESIKQLIEQVII